MNPRSEIHSRYKALALPVIRDYSLILALLLTFSLCSSAGHTETIAADLTLTPFYHQLRSSNDSQYQPSINGLLQRVMSSNPMFNAAPMDPDLDNELAFNYLWMQQQQQDYKHKDGGAAIGKLLRMSIKGLYKSYSGSTSISHGDEDVSRRISAIDYRLRVSGDKVKLAMEYEF